LAGKSRLCLLAGLKSKAVAADKTVSASNTVGEGIGGLGVGKRGVAVAVAVGR